MKGMEELLTSSTSVLILDYDKRPQVAPRETGGRRENLGY